MRNRSYIPPLNLPLTAQASGQTGGSATEPNQRAMIDGRSDRAVSTLATPYGCCGLFDICGDQDLISLSMQGADPFLDWLGWDFTDVCLIERDFIAWTRPAYADGSRTTGYLADPCADPHGVDFGTCNFTLRDFGRIRREGPVRDITMNDVRYCEKQPRYRLDGTQINNTTEFDMRLVSEVMLQDLRQLVITGNETVGGQFAGLQRLIKTGYTNSDGTRCELMDSIVVNWNSNPLTGGAGVTWNGSGISSTAGIVDLLLAILRQIKQRISWSPSLASQPMGVGDIVLVLPTFLARCLLDAFTCWSVCPGGQYNEANLNIYEARVYRQQLNGGMFGAGRIYLDGFEIPLLTYDYGTIVNGAVGDIYVLTGQIGNIKTLQGQLLDMRGPATANPDALFSYTDGGRFLVWANADHTCVSTVMEMRPRILGWAPWAQARIQNVQCASIGPVLGSDPSGGYFGMSASGFYSATCP